MTAGDSLRIMREKLGLTLREVEAASMRLAEIHENPELGMALSRIADIETKGIVPNVYRLYAFAAIYRRSVHDLMALYGLDVHRLTADSAVVAPARTHRSEALASRSVRIPTQLDPGFDLNKTTNMGRMIMRWGTVPLTFLEEFETADYTYGYIGTQDFTMYPILLPGSFVQVDERKRRVMEHGWRTEYERPIYFVETREGYTCCWCEQEGQNTVLLSHPLSPVRSRTLRTEREVEILGQVIAIAMRLDGWGPAETGPVSQLLAKPN